MLNQNHAERDRRARIVPHLLKEGHVVNELGTLAADVLGRGEFPRSGTQILIFAIVVVVLLVVGILLWYYSHPSRRKGRRPPDDGPGAAD